VKVPVTETGLAAIQALKKQHIYVTATAIYSPFQGLMAHAGGVDFMAPYCNRMETLGIDPWALIRALRRIIDESGEIQNPTKILAASFKNTAQVVQALFSGAQAVTVPPALFHGAFENPAVHQALEAFCADWKAIQGGLSITDL
jgi:transaldolase